MILLLRDLEDFMSSVGKVRDAKLIVCNKTRRFKGIAYVEFKDLESVPLAMGLSGQKLMGVSLQHYVSISVPSARYYLSELKLLLRQLHIWVALQF